MGRGPGWRLGSFLSGGKSRNKQKRKTTSINKTLSECQMKSHPLKTLAENAILDRAKKRPDRKRIQNESYFQLRNTGDTTPTVDANHGRLHRSDAILGA